MGDPLYGIDELARLGGVNRRTIRYYVQQGLLPAPAGAGRGARYSSPHLDRLLTVKSLKERGLSLDEVRRELERTGPAHVRHPARHGYRREWSPHHREPHLSSMPPVDAAPAPPVARSAWTRLELGPGVEIHVAGGRRLPSPARLAELAAWCRTHLGDRT